MTDVERAAAIRGKIIDFAWTEGPTKGKTHEHVFHKDGTVEWHDADPSRPAPRSQTSQAAGERPVYGAVNVADDVYAVSYLAPSGYALTVALNFRDRRLVGFASGAKEWFPVRGTFEVVGDTE
jgi:hypothetical protein